MSIEAFNPPDPTDQEKKQSRIEALEQYRRELQDRLRILSVNLNNITQQYNACIGEIISTNTQLSSQKDETGIEPLESYKKGLEDKREILATNLSSVGQEYNKCISDILVTNAWLAAYDADTEGLAREIQAGVVHPASL